MVVFWFGFTIIIVIQFDKDEVIDGVYMSIRKYGAIEKQVENEVRVEIEVETKVEIEIKIKA